MSDYFSEQGQQNPITPPGAGVPQAPVTPTEQPITPSQPTEWQGLPVRAEGDRVFILKGGKKSWVTSPEALEKIGFKLGDEVKIDQATLDVLAEGEPIR